MYKRKTHDEYEIQSWYQVYGWETVTTEETYKEAIIQLRCYRENEPETPHKIVKRRSKP